MQSNVKKIFLIVFLICLVSVTVALCACKTSVYTLTYVADGKVIGQQKYNSNNINIFIPPVPEKEGYEGKWEDFTLRPKDFTVHAVYTPIEYDVTFTADGVTVDVQSYTVEDKNIVVPHAPQKEGYSVAWEDFSLTVGDVTVNAVYTPKQYIVELNYNGATGGNGQRSITVTYGKEIGEMPQPTKGTEVFIGWYYNNVEITPSTVWSRTDGFLPLEARWATATEGLQYSFFEDSQSCMILGKGTSSGDVLIIPYEYKGKPVTKICDMAFNSCSYIRKVIITGNVSVIGSRAFNYCTSLQSVVIPESVSYIGDGAFSSCKLLEKIEVSSKNGVYHSSGNCVIETSSKKLVAGCLTSVIPADGSVTSIGACAFESYGELKNIKLPEGITEISYNAFKWCTKLENVRIPESVTDIGNYAFDGCENLKEIFVPENVENIGIAAFRGCAKVTRIEVSAANDYYMSSGNCLIEKSSKKLIVGCGASVIPDNGIVKEIDDSAFYGSNWLMSIEIPSEVERIGSSAFSNCKNLSRVVIHVGVKKIGEDSFCECISLRTITFVGTKNQWYGIEKDENWLRDSKLNSIVCADGVIEL